MHKTHDGIYINKLVGILAGNASGKTSIIDALGTLGNLMIEPIMILDYNEERKKIRNLIKNMESDKDKINQMIENIKNSVVIEFQNVSRPDDDTYLEVEMYIEDNELTGYYNYILRLNGKERKIVEEKFSYRQNYKDEKNIFLI